jgi:hypothetical protein
MTTGLESFNARELCSRKLWQLVTNNGRSISEHELQEAVGELAARRHYLEELHKLGKLETR